MQMGSSEFVSLSPAINIRQRVRYSIVDVPPVALSFSAKIDRDIPARFASFCDAPDRRA